MAPASLLASILLSGAGAVLELSLVTLVVLAIVAPAVAAAALSAAQRSSFCS